MKKIFKEEKKKLTAGQMTAAGLMTALLCVLGPWVLAIPASPVPISLGSFGIMLAAVILGAKQGTLSCILYLLLGAAGLPVFSGFTGGVGKVFGPTGGYLAGYIFLAFFCGRFSEKAARKRKGGFLLLLSGMVMGNLALYAFGTVWLASAGGMSAAAALAAGVLPFIPGDLVKLTAAAATGPEIRRRLEKAGIILLANKG